MSFEFCTFGACPGPCRALNVEARTIRHTYFNACLDFREEASDIKKHICVDHYSLQGWQKRMKV